MSDVLVPDGAIAPPRPGPAPGVLRFLATGNPFYAISAALFLAGLRLSFPADGHDITTSALMTGLGGYTLLLAATAVLLVRVARVWDDVRTLLLLVVLMFLATSVTLDDALADSTARNEMVRWPYWVGYLFAVAVSEGVLRGVGLRLPAAYRVPYHLALALFFLYPVALSPLMADAEEPLQWALFGFGPVAALVALTLLPAVRRGADSVPDAGPWAWPLYPWALFAVLAFAVPARWYLLCVSLHRVNLAFVGQTIFEPYFLVPFGLALCVLLLEAATIHGRAMLRGAALFAPAVLAALAAWGIRDDELSRKFVRAFQTRLGATPLYLTLWAVMAFYGWAAIRRLPHALEGMTLCLVTLVATDHRSLHAFAWSGPYPLPLALAALVQTTLALSRRETSRGFIAFAASATAVFLVLPTAIAGPPLAAQLVILVLLVTGACFGDESARSLRSAGAIMALIACGAVLARPEAWPAGLPAWTAQAYVPSVATLLAGYGLVLRNRVAQVCAGLVAAVWGMSAGAGAYRASRQLVAGLDYLCVSVAAFALAVLVSLAKAGRLPAWLQRTLGKWRNLLVKSE